MQEPTLEQLRDWSLARYREWDTGGDWGQSVSLPDSTSGNRLKQQASGLIESAQREGRALSDSLSQQALQSFTRQDATQDQPSLEALLRGSTAGEAASRNAGGEQ